MELNSIAALYGGYVDSLLNKSSQNGGAPVTGTNGSGGFSASSQRADSSQLSPLAQIFNTLQHLQETNPTYYQQVTQKIAANLQAAAQTAESSGHADAASQLNQLAIDFANASMSGELPDVQALANVIGYRTPIATEQEDRWSWSSPFIPELNPLSIILKTLSGSGKAAHA
jgi:hypothetical protein